MDRKLKMMWAGLAMMAAGCVADTEASHEAEVGDVETSQEELAGMVAAGGGKPMDCRTQRRSCGTGG